MKKITLILFVFIMMSGCGLKTGKTDMATSQDQFDGEAKVMVYYFHGKQRCSSCIAIQKVTEDAYVQHLVENHDVKYREVDISLKENEALANKYEITWSSLVIASEKEHRNLTEQAFGLALRNPEILQELILTETNNLLNN